MNHTTLVTIVFTWCVVIYVSSEPGILVRLRRVSSSVDSASRNSKPELKATHEQEFTILKCTVNNPRPNVDVFISCPAIGGATASGFCYQGCQPTKSCSKFDEPYEQCVPNESTVFCEKIQLSNGTTSLTLRINRTDPRLAGTWSCAHAGLESTKFEISVQKDDSKDKIQHVEVALSDSKQQPRAETAPQYVQKAQENELEQRPLAYLRRPVVLFSVLAVLIVSVLINLIFCIRCMLMRSYIDANQEGSSQANCLAACLCLPKEMRKAQSIRMTPILPRSNWGIQPNPNGSYQGSAQLIYPSPTMQKMPILVGQQSPNEFSGVSFYPAGSLSGTLRREQRMFGTPSQMEAFNNSHMAYQTAGPEMGDALRSLVTPQQLLQSLNEVGGGANYLQQYIRASTINAPSPNLSQRLPPAPATNNPYQIHNAVDGSGTPQYYVRMPAPMIGSHVVYDDVAAGNSSLLNAYCRSPNGSMGDNSGTMLQLPALYQMNPLKTQQTPESTPLLDSSPHSRSRKEHGSKQQGNSTNNTDPVISKSIPSSVGAYLTRPDAKPSQQSDSGIIQYSQPHKETINGIDSTQIKTNTNS
ncbi:hypothetical protein CSKR_102946 [Clonorchis sinensis]|uniref:Ig-like domain-containing protein n=1 Tax=Clonorchis sinensis TaxID=79923 RepID=A0A419PRH3_CLOSI|nr:hypothetical protein CSKR_102946 [Clonorchis sinensis]